MIFIRTKKNACFLHTKTPDPVKSLKYISRHLSIITLQHLDHLYSEAFMERLPYMAAKEIWNHESRTILFPRGWRDLCLKAPEIWRIASNSLGELTEATGVPCLAALRQVIQRFHNSTANHKLGRATLLFCVAVQQLPVDEDVSADFSRPGKRDVYLL